MNNRRYCCRKGDEKRKASIFIFLILRKHLKSGKIPNYENFRPISFHLTFNLQSNFLQNYIWTTLCNPLLFLSVFKLNQITCMLQFSFEGNFSKPILHPQHFSLLKSRFVFVRSSWCVCPTTLLIESATGRLSNKLPFFYQRWLTLCFLSHLVRLYFVRLQRSCSFNFFSIQN